MTNTDRRIDVFMSKATRFVPEMEALRAIVLGCGVVETFKWRQPCYTAHGANLLIVSSVKDAATINFFKGVLLKDPHGLLVPAGAKQAKTCVARFEKYKPAILDGRGLHDR